MAHVPPEWASIYGSKLDALLQNSIEFDCYDDQTGCIFVEFVLLVEFVSGLLCPKRKKALGEGRHSSVNEDSSDLAATFSFECAYE